MKKPTLTLAIVALGLCGAHAQGTAFSYQGQLKDGGQPAQGIYDFSLRVFGEPTGGAAVSSNLVRDNVAVTGGIFTTELDFESTIFDGSARWMEIGVRPGASAGAFTTLVPRRKLNATPYAIRSLTGGGGGSIQPPLGLGTNTPESGLHVVGPAIADLALFERSGRSATGRHTAARLLASSSAQIGTGFGPGILIQGRTSAQPPVDIGWVGAQLSDDTDQGDIVFLNRSNNALVERYRFGSDGIIHANGSSNSGFVGGLHMQQPNGSGAMISYEGATAIEGFKVTMFNQGPPRTAVCIGNKNSNRTYVGLAGATDPTFPLVVGTPTGGGRSTNGNGAHLTGGGTWTNGSSREFKNAFQPVDPEAVLEKVAQLSLQTWSYKNEGEETRHLGPIAEDFAAAFSLGHDPKYISTVDADGVALAAIQGLHKQLADKDKKIAELAKRLEKLEELLANQ